MFSLEDLEAVIAAVLSATGAVRKPTDRELRMAETIRKIVAEEGAPDLDAIRISVQLASATAEFADACETANRKARALADALADLQTTAREGTERPPE